MRQCTYQPDIDVYLIVETRGGRTVREYTDIHYNSMDAKRKAEVDVLFSNAFNNKYQ